MRLLASLASLALAAVATAEQYDVLVYGATPAGIAAAVAAAKDGERVLLVSPERRIGGMVTNGLSHTDFRTFESLTGSFLDFSRRVQTHYEAQFGDKAGEVSFRGTHGEPKVNLAVFEEMLREQARITVQRDWALEGVKCSSEANGDAAGPMKTAEIALFVDEGGVKHPVPARWFIDATYEGDLMAAVGVTYRVGREGRKEYGEPLAPEEPDSQLQAYNFRLTMTREHANRVEIEAPDEYQRKDFTAILPLLRDGRIDAIFGAGPAQVYKAQNPPLPNGKYDVNDMSHGPVRLSMPGLNAAWPDGGGGVAIREGATDAINAPPFSRTGLSMSRARIFHEHLRWNVGLIYFLQNDSEVPEVFRTEARQWGWCRDEFAETAHLPDQLYVCEARRMLGEYTYTEEDSGFADGDARAVLKRDSIAIGDYGPNCHGTEHAGSYFGGKHSGEFYKPVPPYQIPYGVLVPKDVDNLFVTTAISSSHVGFCTLRFEPIWMSLGEAAGHAVHLSRMERVPVQRISVEKLQTRLHREGSATIYVSDVLPGHMDFAAVQWWGTAGGLHGLAKTPVADSLRGKQIVGQYFESFPNHTADLDRSLESSLLEKWRSLAIELGSDGNALPAAGAKISRGEFLRAAYRSATEQKLHVDPTN